LRAALADATARAERAEQDARDVRNWADAVPVDALRRTYQRDVSADPADSADIEQWFAQTSEAQP